MKVRMPTVASGAFARGQKTVYRMRSSPIPSSRAASISERGTCKKNWRRMRIATALKANGMISAA